MVFADVRAQVTGALDTYARASVSPIVGGMTSGDLRAVLIGEHGVSGVLKPVAVLLCSPECETLRRDARACAAVVRVLYEFHLYCGMRHVRGTPESVAFRDTLLRTVLGTPERVEVGEAFTDDPPRVVVTLDNGVLERAAAAESTSVEEHVRLLRVACDAEVPNLGLDSEEAVGVMRAACLVFALQCTCEEDRVDKVARKGRGPMPGDTAAERAYLAGVAQRLVDDTRTRALSLKRMRERGVEQARAIDEMATTLDRVRFLELLNKHVANRDTPPYATVEARILNDTTMDRGFKLGVLFTGRCAPDYDTVVWANGNVMRRGVARATEVLLREVGEAEFMRVMRVRSTHARHRYRTTETKNRHGHGNDKPSFWALGYETIDDYAAAVSLDEWLSYAEKHK